MSVSLWLGLGLVALGGLATVWGHTRNEYNRLVSDTPTSRVLDVDEPGLVELEGTVRTVGDGEETMASPLQEADCVVAGWEVDEWDERGDSSHWQPVAEGYDSVPFELDDGSASVRVEPGVDADSGGITGRLADVGDLDHSVRTEEATVDFDRLPVRAQVAPDERTAQVESFENQVPAVRPQTDSITNIVDVGNAHGERKYKEATIEPGDDVYVLGHVEPKAGDAGDAVRLRPEDAVVTPAGDERFVLSQRGEEALLDATRFGRVAFLGGLAVVCLGLLVGSGVVF